MADRILIANRGEIAVRIIRTCREMGLETVAVYSSTDKDSLHVRLADHAVCIGPPPSAHSYLSVNNLLMAAKGAGCQAVHPGVGFLSENAPFARAVEDAGLIFIGPRPETIALLGDKVAARAAAQNRGLPVTPGSDGAVTTDAEARAAIEKTGFPVIIKAAAGGGGKGMRIVRNSADLDENLSIARAEAEAAFADSTVFIEKFLENPRHVELQLIADGKGTVAILGERDCTVQKNHQKLIEESPSPAVNKDVRRRMMSGAESLFRELGYRGAGTIEFLFEDGEFYFMEVNARIQVEHPVSEMVSGVDIVREQINAAFSGKIETQPVHVRLSGHALECRINALSPGKITRLEIPGGAGVRFDSFLSCGCTVPPYYDSMVGKLIVHDTTRERAISRMERALSELVIEGVPTNIIRQRRIIADKTFRSGVFGASYYESIAKEIEA